MAEPFSKILTGGFSALILTACSGPTLSPEAQRVHTVTDTSGCDYVMTEPFTGLPATVHDYIKQRVINQGGNAYKVLSSAPASAWSKDDVERVTYEVWRCPE